MGGTQGCGRWERGEGRASLSSSPEPVGRSTGPSPWQPPPAGPRRGREQGWFAGVDRKGLGMTSQANVPSGAEHSVGCQGDISKVT